MRLLNLNIWILALGYFFFYIPNTYLTRRLVFGLGIESVPGPTLLPLITISASMGMLLFIWLTSIWKSSQTKNFFVVTIPFPRIWTLLSGLCTSLIIITTAFSYTFKDASIVFVMLLMRGGVLIIAPIIDHITKRVVHWYSWVGLLLSMAALFIAFWEKGTSHLQALLVVDIAIYILSYFARLQIMSRYAKTEDYNKRQNYFAEEMISASILSIVILVVIAIFIPGQTAQQLANGFNIIMLGEKSIFIILNGICFMGVGVFGSLILLDQRENAYCIPINRSSGILAGITASYLLYFEYSIKVSPYKLTGAMILVAALFVLILPDIRNKARKELV